MKISKKGPRMKTIYKILWITPLTIIIACIVGFYHFFPIIKPFPALNGPYEVGIQTIQLTDQRRTEIYSNNPADKRSLMVQMWYPSADNLTKKAQKHPYLGPKMPILQKAVAGYYGIPEWMSRLMLNGIATHVYQNAPLSQNQKMYPVILFSHGLLGSIPSDMYVIILEHLASNGYVVLNIDHPYFSGLTLYPDGRIVSSHELNAQFQKMSPEEQKEFQTKAIDIYKADVQFVLNQLNVLNQDPESILYQHLDLNRIGVMGHSAGGTAAIELCRIDNRCKAAIDLDGWYDQAIGHEPIKKPLLLLFGSQSIEVTEPTAEYLARKNITREQYYEREQNIEEHKKELCNDPLCSMVIIPGASHGDFGDEVLFKWPLRPWSAADSYTTIELINQNILKFLDNYLQ